MHQFGMVQGAQGKSNRRLLKKGLIVVASLCGTILMLNQGHADGWLPSSPQNPDDDRSAAPNRILNNTLSSDGLRIGGIANTRHNLTMSYTNQSFRMDTFRNNYYEICVYCHTPHGANSTADAPLWNRTVAQRTYTLYNQDTSTGSTVFPEPTALDLNYSQPGPNSLTCLSCHDGATAIDSIINMPTQLAGEFRAGYNANQQTTVNSEFLDKWSDNKLGTTSPADPDIGGSHANFANTGSGSSSYCLSCHNPGVQGARGQGPDFRILVIGDRYSEYSTSDFAEAGARNNYLADDHPIGVEYPKDFSGNVDYYEPDVKLDKIAFFDLNGNGHADPNEVRLYDTGDGYEVECGSCHDPHGVKVDGSSNELIPSFLRVGERAPLGVSNQLSNADRNNGREFIAANTGSGLCLTCHVK